MTINCNLKNDKDKILESISEIVDPIAQTMSPRGGNVLFRDEQGKAIISNDGATICKYIKPEDELKRIIVDTIIESSQQTNKTAGDATSTTILLNGAILRLFIEKEVSQYEFIEALKKVKTLILTELEKIRKGGEGLDSNMEDIKRVAYISSNNQKEISETAVEVAVAAGEYGIVRYDDKSSNKTKVQVDKGFIIPNAVPDPVFLNNNNTVDYKEMAVFITDSKFFYQEDLNNVLEALQQTGKKDFLIVAKEFSAKTPQMLYNLQNNSEANVLPIALSQKDFIHDLAAYLGVEVYTESLGRMDKELDTYIGNTNEVGGTMQFVAIQGEDNNKRKDRTELIKSLLEKNKEDGMLQARLASMTSGIVTLFVGGDTDIERTENKMKFEDAILASQKAMGYGYLPGGGTSLVHIYETLENTITSELELEILAHICYANIRQIVANCDVEHVLEPVDITFFGFNATTGEWVDMEEEGIYDSYTSVEQSLVNAISTSSGLISAMSNTVIINDNKQ